MSNGDGPLRGIADEMLLVMAPLVEAAKAPDDFVSLLADLGWTVASVPEPLLEFATAGSTLLDLLASDRDVVSTTQVIDAIGQLAAAVDDIATQPDTAFPTTVDIASFKQTIGRDLLDYCVVEYLLRYRFKVGLPLKVAGIVQLIDVPANGLRQEHLGRDVNWSEIGTLLTDPLTGFAEVYGWRTATPQLPHALSDVAALLESYGLQFSFFALTPEQLAFANAGALEPMSGQVGVELNLGEALGVPADNVAGVQFFVRPATATRGPAIAIVPFADLSSSPGPPPDDEPSLTVTADADLTQGFAVTLSPDHEPVVEGGFLGGGAPTSPTRLQVTLTVPPIPGAPERVILGAPDASRLSLHTLTASTGVALIVAQQVEAFVNLQLDKLRVVVKPGAGEADAFLADLLGPDGISAELSSGLRVSSVTGFHLTGSAGLDGSFQVDAQFGPVDVQTISLALRAVAQGVDFEVGASVGAELGPFAVEVDRVGFVLSARFPDPPVGNLGPIDVAFGFLPPTGIGVSVDADVLTGGGFIGYDSDTGRYSGVLDLRAGDVDIAAIGLLDTKLPAGQGDYALVVILSATFPGVEVGFGFALTGVGGLLALNRHLDVDALRARLAAGTAGRILAPQDPIRNAPALVADLDAVLPVAPGVTVIGPTVKLVWADLVNFDVGVFLEFPGPSRVVVLGSAYAEIASGGRTYLSIRVDIVGVVDLRAETSAFDAVLVDSHLMGMLDLTGGAAFRLSWGSQPYAVLTLGGFNPNYNPAPLSFPSTLTRIAMVHGKPSDEVYLRFEGYFAVTSNTLQFGASVEAAINDGGFAINGSLSFDALIQFVPFHFEIDIRASVSVAYHGDTLAGLTLTGSLTGPGPVVLQAKVCIELLFFDICFSGTYELGPSSPPPQPPPPDLFAILVGELTAPNRLRPAGGPDPLVQLRPADPSLTTPLAIPTGTIVWEQHRAPLDLLLTRIGGTPLPAPVAVAASGGAAAGPQSDWFAPGQFLDLTDDEALTQPGYELLTGGLRLSGTATSDGPAAQATLSVRQIRLPTATTTKPILPFPIWVLSTAPPSAPAMIAITIESWVVVGPDGTRQAETGAQARQLAAFTPGATAIPATDTLAAVSF
jgi:hypothetical protein